jgi:ubiquinone/menaquinone biosynthesis C-methylase UbiE
MFNRKASSSKSKPDEVIAALSIRKGHRIADIGAGGGYFTCRFAEAVGEDGQVYAVDTDQELSDCVKETALEKGLSNIETVNYDGRTLEIPRGVLDLIFMRNVTHHIENLDEYLRMLRVLLNRNGKVAIIEYKPAGRFSFRGAFGHFVPKGDLIREMVEAGYYLEIDHDFLPEQSFTIYSVKSP